MVWVQGIGFADGCLSAFRAARLFWVGWIKSIVLTLVNSGLSENEGKKMNKTLGAQTDVTAKVATKPELDAFLSRLHTQNECLNMTLNRIECLRDRLCGGVEARRAPLLQRHAPLSLYKSIIWHRLSPG